MFQEMLRRGSKSSSLWNGVGGVRVPVLFTLMILFLIAFILLSGHDETKPKPGDYSVKWNSFDSLVKLDPTVEIRNGTEVIWQIPKSPRAVIFLAHGCGGRAVNFWDKTPKCEDCIGLPEERLIVLHALARNFAVVAISSADNCWSFGKERVVVKGIIQWWVEKFKLEKLPLVALGASSGGYFVSMLATDIRFSSITVMIAEGLYNQMDITKDYPPTLFVHMPKDGVRKEKIDAYMEILKDEGIDVAEVKCKEFPLSPNFLADRIPGLDMTTSLKLFSVLRGKGFIDENGYMKSDGRAIHLKAAFRENNISPPVMNLFHHIKEELNLAFAFHEMTSLQCEQIFDWFNSHMS